MLYKHHGKNYCFSRNYNEYASDEVDTDALLHLQCANHMLKTLYKDSIVIIAEDISNFM